MRGALILALLWASGASGASAQRADSATTDSIFLRAQRMVAEGKGDAGRALVQAEFVRSPTGSPRYIEALYWRGALAARGGGPARRTPRSTLAAATPDPGEWKTAGLIVSQAMAAMERAAKRQDVIRATGSLPAARAGRR